MKYNPLRFSELRKHLNKTKEEMANELGISIRTLFNYESIENGSGPTCVIVAKMCNLYNITPDYLFTYSKKDKDNSDNKDLIIELSGLVSMQKDIELRLNELIERLKNE